MLPKTAKDTKDSQSRLNFFLMWLHSLSTLEFTHNNRRHAEQIHTPFKLIQGDSPISIPITFSHTKYLSIKEKMK